MMQAVKGRSANRGPQERHYEEPKTTAKCAPRAEMHAQVTEKKKRLHLFADAK
jgi:hypothetical protein